MTFPIRKTPAEWQAVLAAKNAEPGALQVTRQAATDYLNWLWSPEAQEIAAKHHLRPRNAEVLARHAKDFPQQQTFTVDELFGGWSNALKVHFSDGGTYDKAMAQRRK